jgi:uncharacterized RDD family membrane protein YckC
MNEHLTRTHSPFAGFFVRGFSFAIDLFLLLIVFLVIDLQFSVSFNSYFASEGEVVEIMWKNPLNAGLFLAAFIVYAIIMEFLWSATIGKFISRTRVLSLGGEKLSLQQLIIRNIFTPLDIIFGPAFFLFSKKNQVIGDKISETVVIRKKFKGETLQDRPLSLFRKLFAGLFLTLTILSIFFSLVTAIPAISKIPKVNEAFHRTLEDIVLKSSAGDSAGLYDSFSAEFQGVMTLEEFDKIFLSLQEISTDLDPQKVQIYSWKFDSIRSHVIAKSGEWIVVFVFISNELDEWVLSRFEFKPNRDISLIDLFSSSFGK